MKWHGSRPTPVPPADSSDLRPWHRACRCGRLAFVALPEIHAAIGVLDRPGVNLFVPRLSGNDAGRVRTLHDVWAGLDVADYLTRYERTEDRS
jgi:hypothetical protein